MQNIQDIIKGIETQSHAELRVTWGRLLREPCPSVSSARLLRVMLAGKLQEKEEEGASLGVRAKLRRLSKHYAENPDYVPADVPRLKPGTALNRTWKGTRYEVRVTSDGGYRFKGREYYSLSEIAREITGTRWSGPRFFGLKAKS